MVCAARWKTVRISYSPRARSINVWSTTSPRTMVTLPAVPERASSLCGTRSRSTQTTSAPAASSRFTSQLPTRPAPPVTSTGRSRQRVIARPASFPELPRRVAARPELVQMLVLAERVHGVEEAVVLERAELAVERELLERLLLEHAVVAAEVIEPPPVEDEESGVRPLL